ncbi:NAD(P)-binding protein [Epithele typhae]|uniref:NAD(P)-binding protein n=1 Tax=Epithele typhae TaxID=378194 RepID=UPI002007743A|nr:NAD(P)-binding protein [Epithele typhae]KAH9926551.1 NAD(P)-binding protein [Epithele typhae]
MQKLILVIGATGAQGLAVIDKLLEPSQDGTQSPYSVRALTRNPDGARAKELAARGVDVVKGAFNDFPVVLAALQGVWGVWNNTDGFTVGEMKELYAGVRIFELAKQVGTVRHYVWSNLDYSLKKGGWNPTYCADHYNGKGRVADWMKAQPSIVSDTDMSWAVVTSGPYMEMLLFWMFGPLGQRPDGTAVFAAPIGDGHVPMVALDDLGFFARYAFDHRADVAGRDLEVASARVGWAELAATYARVTGRRAEYLPLSLDEWLGPIANERGQGGRGGGGRGDVGAHVPRVLGAVAGRRRRPRLGVAEGGEPGGHTLESWMRAKGYKGVEGDTGRTTVLKNVEEGKSVRLNFQRVEDLLASKKPVS